MRTRSLAALAVFLSLSACSMAPRREAARPPAQPAPVPRPVIACRDCGRIEKVEMVSNVRATSTGRPVLGGVVGGVVAGKPTTPGGGAKPGVQVLTFRIAVAMEDGRRLVIYQPELAPGLRAGSRIRVQNGRVLPPR